MALLGEVARGAYALASMAGADITRARAVIEQHAGLGVSLADASIVVLGERHATIDVVTLDQRHFRVLAVSGESFRVLPADS